MCERERWVGDLINWLLIENNVTSYKFFKDIENKINFHVIIKFAYLSFFLNLFLCIFLPITLRHPKCQRGLEWSSHVIFGSYLILSFFVEFLIFFLWFNKEARNSFFENTSTKKTLFIFALYSIIGLVSKADIYTDIAFIVELCKCAEKEKIGSEEYFTAEGLIAITVSIIIFAFTIFYQIMCFVRLIFKSPKTTFNPLTSHSTRLLMWSDFRMLGMWVDKFSVSYYESIFKFRIPTFKILAFFKLVFEDIAQASIQVIYLLFISENQDEGESNKISEGKVTTKQVSLVIITAISLWFAFPSMLSSILSIIYNTTSSLKKNDYDKMMKRIPLILLIF